MDDAIYVYGEQTGHMAGRVCQKDMTDKELDEWGDVERYADSPELAEARARREYSTLDGADARNAYRLRCAANVLIYCGVDPSHVDCGRAPRWHGSEEE